MNQIKTNSKKISNWLKALALILFGAALFLSQKNSSLSSHTNEEIHQSNLKMEEMSRTGGL